MYYFNRLESLLLKKILEAEVIDIDDLKTTDHIDYFIMPPKVPEKADIPAKVVTMIWVVS